MKDKLLKLGRHSFIYGIGNALSVAAGFLLIPLYTNMLSASEYGILELLNRTGDILMLLMFMGSRQAFIRFYFDKDTEEWHKAVLGSIVVFVIFSSLTVVSLFFPFKGYVARNLFKNISSEPFIILLLIWLPFEILVNIGMTLLQIQMKSVLYVLINFIRLVLTITSNIILVYFYRKGIIGIFTTNIWVSGIIALNFLIFFIYWTKLKISFSIIKGILKFGLPYLPTAFFMYIISNSDRFFLTHYSDLDSVGIYALAYKIGMFGISFLMDPFGKVWSPFLYANYNTPEGNKLISKVFTLYTLVSVGMGLSISIFSPVIIPIISGKVFHSAYKLVPLICTASVFYGMARLADAGILISKKTGYKPLIFGISAFISVILNLILIPPFGATGAAITLALTFFSLFVVNYSISSKFYVIEIEYRKMLIIFSSATIAYLVSNYVFYKGQDIGFIKLMSLLTILIYPFLLWVGGFFSSSEKKIIFNFITRRNN
ncbi:MAG: oligosaccharide flippase family protein [Candidatus Helarchaeota archaeon]